MENFDLEKALKQALSHMEQPKPTEHKQGGLYVEARRAERDAARQEYRERIRHTDALVKSLSYTCTVCGKSATFETVKKLSYFTLDGGQIDVQAFKLAHGSMYFVEDGKPVMQGNPTFVVCSNECRRAWIRKYWKTCPTIKYWLKLTSTIPRNVHVAEELAELKNETADKAGITNCDALDDIQAELNGKKGFYLFGDSGCGKTTIAACLANQYILDEKTVKWVSYNDLQEALEMKFANATLAGFVYRNVDAEYDKVISKGAPWEVVVLDDISNDFPPNSPQHARLKRLFSQWYETRCKLIITSNVDVEELGKSIGKMVFSRLMEMVHFVPLPKVDFRAEP